MAAIQELVKRYGGDDNEAEYSKLSGVCALCAAFDAHFCFAFSAFRAVLLLCFFPWLRPPA